MNIDLKLLLNRAVSSLQEEIRNTTATLRDKGWRRFSRAFVAGGAFVLASYMLIYSPASAKLEMIGQRIAAAKSEFDSADSYKSLSGGLNAIYSHLPSKQKGDWLNASVLNCLEEEGVTADSIMPKEDADTPDSLLHESLTVTAGMRYSQLLAVLNRLEHLRPRVDISSIHLKKDTQLVGNNQVTLEIDTLIPTQRFTP